MALEAPLTLESRERFNVFSGDNGQGKTNLLEAIFVDQEPAGTGGAPQPVPARDQAGRRRVALLVDAKQLAEPPARDPRCVGSSSGLAPPARPAADG